MQPEPTGLTLTDTLPPEHFAGTGYDRHLTIERTELLPQGAVLRLRANSGYTQKEGWHGKEITVELTGPAAYADTLRGIYERKTLELHAEITDACDAMNRAEGRG